MTAEAGGRVVELEELPLGDIARAQRTPRIREPGRRSLRQVDIPVSSRSSAERLEAS